MTSFAASGTAAILRSNVREAGNKPKFESRLTGES